MSGPCGMCDDLASLSWHDALSWIPMKHHRSQCGVSDLEARYMYPNARYSLEVMGLAS
jgi:hypothetical protein